ncbi:MAG: CDP-alcohol phosphatidyltransferase family protein [Acidobacteriota bacterium]
MTISDSIGRGAKVILDAIVWTLTRLHIRPNALTVTGLLISVAAAYALAYGYFGWAGLILIFAGLFDMLDGAVARISNRETAFGAFLDSVLDRYSDMIVLLGLTIYYGRNDRLPYVVLVGTVIMGTVLTSYARARAESLISKCKVGFLERPERVVLLIIGALSGRMEAVLWVLAILSNWTVIHRILYVRKVLPLQTR